LIVAIIQGTSVYSGLRKKKYIVTSAKMTRLANDSMRIVHGVKSPTISQCHTAIVV